MSTIRKPNDRPRGKPNLAGEVVLLVEDDRPLRRMVGIQLQSLGYTVLEAEDGKGALAILQSSCDIDLLLTDVVLAQSPSGTELAAKARELRPGLKLMFMSGYPNIEELRRASQQDDIILLRKPFRRDDVAVQVRKALSN